MKIYYASDIHSEFRPYPETPRFGADADVIVLAGDIGVGTQASAYVGAIASDYPEANIIWVAGNHEFYGGDLDLQLDRFRDFARQHERIHFLENNKVALNGITFLGCTLWTDFSSLGDEMARLCMSQGWQRLADGSNIHCGGRNLSCEDVIKRFRCSYRWLDEELSCCDPDKTVVVTHFPPCREARHMLIPEDYLSAYFQANARDLVEAYRPRVWIYGHNHWPDRLKFGNTRLVSNQLGYPNERETLQRFRDSACIEMPPRTPEDT